MKNKLKYLALLLILPVAFAFTGCGGGQLDGNAKVNTGKEASYEAATMEDLTDYVATITEGDEAAVPTGAKITVNFTAGAYANGKVNVLFKVTEDEEENTNLEFAVRANVNYKDGDTAGKVKADLYYKDQVLYLDANVTGVDQETAAMVNGKQKLDLSEMGGIEGLLGMAMMFLPGDVTEEMPFDMAMLPEMFENFDLNVVLGLLDVIPVEFDVATYTDGDYTRFKLSAVDAETNDTIVAYLVFVQGVLAGVQVNAQMTEGEDVMSLAVAIEAFAGDIQYPNFNGYTEAQLPSEIIK